MAFLLVLQTFSGASESPLTLEQIDEAYSHKLGQVGSYRVRYDLRNEYSKSGEAPVAHQYVKRLTVSGARYRLETAIQRDPTQPTVPFKLEADDGDLKRILMYRDDGQPDAGTIRAAGEGFAALSSILYAPIGLSGLVDGSCFFEPGQVNSGSFSADIRALARDPRSRLLDDSVVLNGEECCVVEWPSGQPHPQMRFWLAVDKGLALVKYEYYSCDQSGKQQTEFRTVNSGFVEVAPGLFLPNESVFRRLNESAGLPALTTTIKLVDVELGADPEDAEFVEIFPAGVGVTNELGGVKHVQDLFEDVFGSGSGQARPGRRLPTVWVVVAVVGLSLAALVIYVAVKAARSASVDDS